MDVGALLGRDPAGSEVMALCVLAALALVAMIVGGFVLLWRADRGTRQVAGRSRPGPRELGLLAPWRLERALRGYANISRREGAWKT